MRVATNIQYRGDDILDMNLLRKILPSKVLIPDNVADNTIADYIFQKTGWKTSRFTKQNT